MMKNNVKRFAALMMILTLLFCVSATAFASTVYSNVISVTVTEAPVETEEPAVEEPVADEEPAVEEPVADEEPVVEEPVADEEPVVEEPVADEEPVVEEPVADEEPVVEEPVADEEPVVEEPVADEEPVVEEPVADEEPVVEEPVADEEPVVEEPEATEESFVEQPVDEAFTNTDFFAALEDLDLEVVNEDSQAPAPEVEDLLANVSVVVNCQIISESGAPMFGDTVELTAVVDGAEGLEYDLVWESRTNGSEWAESEGMTGEVVTFPLSVDNFMSEWRARLVLVVPEAE